MARYASREPTIDAAGINAARKNDDRLEDAETARNVAKNQRVRAGRRAPGNEVHIRAAGDVNLGCGQSTTATRSWAERDVEGTGNSHPNRRKVSRPTSNRHERGAKSAQRFERAERQSQLDRRSPTGTGETATASFL
jgi:hypothetical protein